MKRFAQQKRSKRDADIIAANTAKLLAGVEMPKPDTHCLDDDTQKDCWSYSLDQLQAYAAAAALNARREALEEANEVCICLIAPYGAHMPEKSVYQ